jgi:hypothetical protein
LPVQCKQISRHGGSANTFSGPKRICFPGGQI